MGVDPLYRPLGIDAPDDPFPRRARRGVTGALAVLVAVGAGWLTVRTLRHPGAPEAVASIEVAPASAPAPVASPKEPVGGSARVVDAQPAPVPGSTVEVQNGVKIVRFNPAASGPLTVGVEEAARAPLRPAPDPRISEPFRRGVLPRLGSGGLRPADVYASPVPTAKGPVVALLLDDMGADQVATADASRRLAGPVSFAFGSAAHDAPAQVAEARRAGHEVFMSVAGGGPLDALQSEMAQFPGYVGLLLGEGWLASPGVSKDVAGRGLLLVPDEAAPAAPIDLRVDAAGGAPAVQAALDQLLALAKRKGTAAALVAHGALASGQVAAFANSLASQGVTLVPASALLSPNGSAGRAPATVRAQ